MSQSATTEPEVFRHTRHFDVRYSDLDVMGHLNNVALMRYLEAARIDYFVDLDVVGLLELDFVIVNLQVDFRGQAHFRDQLSCGTRAARIGNRSLQLRQRLARDPDQVVATATSTMVFLDDDRVKAKPVPDSWRRAMERWEQGHVGAQPHQSSSR